VIAKNAARNALIVSQDSNHPHLLAKSLIASPFHWIRRPEQSHAGFTSRIRHRQVLQACTLNSTRGDTVEVTFGEPQRAAVPGQYLVLYDSAECLGGGEIDTVTTLT